MAPEMANDGAGMAETPGRGEPLERSSRRVVASGAAHLEHPPSRPAQTETEVDVLRSERGRVVEAAHDVQRLAVGRPGRPRSRNRRPNFAPDALAGGQLVDVRAVEGPLHLLSKCSRAPPLEASGGWPANTGAVSPARPDASSSIGASSSTKARRCRRASLSRKHTNGAPPRPVPRFRPRPTPRFFSLRRQRTRGSPTTAGGVDPLSTTVTTVSTPTCAERRRNGTVEQLAVVPRENDHVDLHETTRARLPARGAVR